MADFSYRGTRVQELHKFIHSSDCFVLLLSKQGSVGLDLSFVTHIFFLGMLVYCGFLHQFNPVNEMLFASPFHRFDI